mmetsp:Transcript_80915/g.142750  ORF Transcript_80915/g.142750 Transcript_80915/m.142750 type:complete len:312 (+) Transcript_80915:597-1532(+)
MSIFIVTIVKLVGVPKFIQSILMFLKIIRVQVNLHLVACFTRKVLQHVVLCSPQKTSLSKHFIELIDVISTRVVPDSCLHPPVFHFLGGAVALPEFHHSSHVFDSMQHLELSDELNGSIQNRSAGEHQDQALLWNGVRHLHEGFRAIGLASLQLVTLIHDQRLKTLLQRILQSICGFEKLKVDDDDIDVFRKLVGVILGRENARLSEWCPPQHLLCPVEFYGEWTNNQGGIGAVPEKLQSSKSLDCLTQAHLICQEAASLPQDELNTRSLEGFQLELHTRNWIPSFQLREIDTAILGCIACSRSLGVCNCV